MKHRMRFQKLTLQYKQLLLGWFGQPHVSQFYYGDGLKNTLNNVDLYCQGINDNGRYSFDHWLAFYDNRPFAFFMTSPITGPYNGKDDYNQWYQQGKKILTLDLLIGDPAFLGKGLAHRMIQRFILDQYRDADFFMIDPEDANAKAIHVYEKAGFEKIKHFCPANNPKRHLMMRLVVSDLKRQGITEDMRLFVNNVKNVWGAEGSKWLDHLPSCVKRLSDCWSLADIMPVSNMSYNYVARAIQNKQKPVVLKISCDKTRIEEEANALKHFDGTGSVKLLAINVKDNAMLIEQAIPGGDLNAISLMNIQEAIRIYAEVIREMASRPLLANHYRHVGEWCKAIDRVKEGDIDQTLLTKAAKIRSELLSSVESEYLCHGDLHLGNVLQHEERWISIDPKGIMGEIAFEASAFNFVKKAEWHRLDSIKNTVISRIHQLANFLEIDEKRLLQWVFLREMISAQWFIEDRGDPTQALKLASLLVNEV